MHWANRWLFRGFVVLFMVTLLAFGGGSCQFSANRPTLLFIGIDGANPWIIDDLRSVGKLPHLDRLIRRGVFGPLESIQSLRVLEPVPKKGYWSPVVWASMATGKVPEKHGILDFRLPVPGTSFVWAGSQEDPPRALVRLSEISGRVPWKLEMRLRSYEPNAPQSVTFWLNGQLLGRAQLTAAWKVVELPVSKGALRPIRNDLVMEFERQTTPAAYQGKDDQRNLAAAVGFIRVRDAGGEEVVHLEPVMDRFSFLKGFHVPEAKNTFAQSIHWREPPVWQLLGRAGSPVGVVGYWATWPAYEVNGFLVSSHVGLRGLKRGKTTQRLTWPPELAQELLPLAPTDGEVEKLMRRFASPGCVPTRPDKWKTFAEVLWQDDFYWRIGRKLMDSPKPGFYSIYFESVDVASHNFLPLRDGAPLPEGCGEEARGIVASTYEQIDQWVGGLLARMPRDVTVFIVSDHGLVTVGDRGDHYPWGMFLASGPAIRKSDRLWGASVLDVAPTLLYLFDVAIPLDMDGKLLVQILEPAGLKARPPRYVPATPWQSIVTAVTGEDEPGEKEILERLRGIGYLDGGGSR